MTPAHAEAAGRDGILRRLGEALVMFIVTLLSLILLVYVGYGEGKRTYGEFHTAKVVTQAGTVRNALEAFLRDGLPIRQFAGFNSLAGPIVETEYVDAIFAFDVAGREVFRTTDSKLTTTLQPPTPSKSGDQTEVQNHDGYNYITVPLRSRFEAAGTLVVATSDTVATKPVRAAFVPLISLAVVLSALFAIAVVAARARLGYRWNTWLHVAYAGVFLSMSGVVIWSLVSLYSEGAQDKARVLADMLAQRIGEIVQYDLSLQDITGVDTAFAEYRKLNPDIDAVALVVDGRTQIHTDAAKVGQYWRADPNDYAYVISIGGSSHEANIGVAVEVPREIVYRQVARSVKNFAAMFIASAFLAGLFLQVAASLQNLRRTEEDEIVDGKRCNLFRERAALSSVKPLFFIAVFLEHLTYSFLPQHMQHLATAEGLSASFASAPFMIYYLFFALSLIPSGHFSQRFGPRVSMNGGLVLAGAGLLALVLPIGFWGALAARAASGVGQGMLFIGVQSYILAIASAHNRTQGNGIIVFGFQGGMISGMAIGSLLVTYLGSSGVFELAGLLAFVTACYGLTLVPAEAAAPAGRNASFTHEMRVLFQDVSRVLRHSEFIRAMFLIGIPAKATLTGIITFALPLLLARSQYKQEDIGQIVMLYAIGVVASSHYATRLVDRSRRTAPILVWGAAISGLAMLAIGLPDWNAPVGSWSTWVVVLGVVAVGVAHGCVNAPVVTHIAELDLAKIIGIGSVTATYRFLERLGHIAGPIVVGQLFMLMGTTPHVIALFGGVTCALALIFLSALGGGGTRAHAESAA